MSRFLIVIFLGLAAFAAAAPGYVEQHHVLLHASSPVVAVKHVAVAAPVVKTVVPVVPVVKTVVPVAVPTVVKSYVPVHHVKSYAIAGVASSPYAHYYHG